MMTKFTSTTAQSTATSSGSARSSKLSTTISTSSKHSMALATASRNSPIKPDQRGMALEFPGWPEPASIRRALRAIRVRLWRFSRQFLGHYRFNSITRRIIVINLLGVVLLVAGIFYVNQYRVTFVTNRVDNLTTQAGIIASAIAQTSKNSTAFAGENSQQAGENGLIVSRGIANPELSFRIDP